MNPNATAYLRRTRQDCPESPIHLAACMPFAEHSYLSKSKRAQKSAKVERTPDLTPSQGWLPAPVAGLLGSTDQQSPMRRAVLAQGVDLLGGTTVNPGIIARLRSRSGQGAPLPPSISESVGTALGTDLSAVRVHDDPEAATISRSLQARAFTHGTDVYFTGGSYAPESSAGQRLLLHELAHVSENLSDRAGAPGGHLPTIGRALDPAEAAAEATSNRLLPMLRRSTMPLAFGGTGQGNSSMISAGGLRALRRQAASASSETDAPVFRGGLRVGPLSGQLRRAPAACAGPGVIRRVLVDKSLRDGTGLPANLEKNTKAAPGNENAFRLALWNFKFQKNTSDEKMKQIEAWLRGNDFADLAEFCNELWMASAGDKDGLRPAVEPPGAKRAGVKEASQPPRKLLKNYKLADRQKLATSWNGDGGTTIEGTPLFAAMMTSQDTLDFALDLTAEQRKVVTAEIIQSLRMPAAQEWAVLRRANVATMNPADKKAVAAGWTDVSSERAAAAVSSQECYLFFQRLSAEQRTYISVAQIEKLQKPTAKDKESFELEVAAARSAVRKNNQEKSAADKEASVAKKAAQARSANNTLEAEYARVIALVAAHRPQLGMGSRTIDPLGTLVDIKKDMLAKSVKLGDVESELSRRVEERWRWQRSPSDLQTWVTWMRLKPYETFIEFGGLMAHFSWSNESLRAPDLLTQPATALSLLKQLFGTETSYTRAHVTLKTNATDRTGLAAHPHRRWKEDIQTVRDLQTDQDGRATPWLWRWNQQKQGQLPLAGEAGHTEVSIRAALNAAHAHIETEMLARAQAVLDAQGRLKPPDRTPPR